jgi:GT2 family glycosyltransferase
MLEDKPLFTLVFLNRLDLALRSLESLPELDRILIIGNGCDPKEFETLLEKSKGKSRETLDIYFKKNTGVSHAWNTALNIPAEFWIFMGADVRPHKGSVELLIRKTRENPRAAMLTPAGFNLFTLTKNSKNIVGLFDENYFPAYWEDSDYYTRICRSGLESIEIIEATYDHGDDGINGSTSITNNNIFKGWFEDFEYKNNKYFRRKWGILAREEEVHNHGFQFPFNNPGWKND